MKALVLKASGGGGLGDCVKSLIVASHYASLSGRALYVDWSGGVYSDHGNDPFRDVFNIVEIPTLDALPTGEDIYPPAWQGRIDKSLHEVYEQDGWQSWNRAKVIERYSFDLSILDYSNDVLVMWEFDQIAKLVPQINTAALSALCQRYIQIAEPIERRLVALLDQYGTPKLGVHIRATTEFSNNKLGYGLQDYLDVVHELLSEREDKAIYLATDNFAVEREFRETFADTVTLAKWFATPGESIHLNPACPSKLEALQAAILDVLMLAQCKELVITPGSSFSELAQIFSPSNISVSSPQRATSSVAKKIKTKLLSLVRQT